MELDCEVGSKVDTGFGDFRERRARDVTESVWVAEKSNVWRDLGKWDRRAVRVRENPISNTRSASSRTEGTGALSLIRDHYFSHLPRTWRLSDSKPTVWSMCCKSRPGVATSMFILESRSRSSFKLLPPITNPAEKLWYPPIDLSTSNIWTA